ncbi:hypothetical protein [Streptomyces liliifuscus]|uniref:Uncharacterized protein n=1 Tax=Streptomyces liliifuscus TaxID=2797636 RepID=A0A7T7L1Z8_9ACTN|nr:hypothetical protein [Streptomyces liliifuscus]QQM44977.1 hypothetical protein JEQ17_39970 [Streptomyces liliifuscus]
MTVLVLFSALCAVVLFIVALGVADRLREARPLPRVVQRTLPPLPGAYVEDVRTRIPGRHGRRARPVSVVCGLLLPCEGTCRGRTRHEDDGDGTATCMPCGTPRPVTTDGV